MAFIPVQDTVQACLNFVWQGQRVQICLYFRKDDFVFEVSVPGLAVILRDWWVNTARTLFTTAIELDTITIVSLKQQNAPGYELPVTTSRSGSQSADAVPNNVAACVTHVTGLRGRSYRGRNYLPGLPEANFSGSTLAAGVVTAILTAYNALQTAALAQDWQHVVVSRYSNNAPRAEGVTTLVTAYKMDNIADSQRRRLPGRGR